MHAWHTDTFRHRLLGRIRRSHDSRDGQRAHRAPVEQALLLQNRIEILDFAHIINLVSQTLRLRRRCRNLVIERRELLLAGQEVLLANMLLSLLVLSITLEEVHRHLSCIV